MESAVSGYEGISKLRKLFIALSKPFRRKPAEVAYVEYLTETYYDEEENIEYVIRFVCKCEERVIRLTDFGSFYCPHCDRICYAGKSCLQCKTLFEEEPVTEDE